MCQLRGDLHRHDRWDVNPDQGSSEEKECGCGMAQPPDKSESLGWEQPFGQPGRHTGQDQWGSHVPEDHVLGHVEAEQVLLAEVVQRPARSDPQHRQPRCESPDLASGRGGGAGGKA